MNVVKCWPSNRTEKNKVSYATDEFSRKYLIRRIFIFDVMWKFIVLILAFLFNNQVQVQAQNLDIEMLRQFNVERNVKFDGSYRFITSTSTPISIAAPVTMLVIGMTQKDSSLTIKSLEVLGSIAINLLITTPMKYGIKRERPFETYPDIVKLTKGSSPSFPSGHTSMAFSAATSFSICYPKWYVIAPSFLWASAVGYSRMHLGVHYPSDVFFGALIGSGSAWLSHILSRQIVDRRKSRAQKL